MSYKTSMSMACEAEKVISMHTAQRWQRRERELQSWLAREKITKHPKQTLLLGHVSIDAELLPALTLLKEQGIPTEFSCAGVSVLDEPEDHSLYAYITFPACEQTERFIQLAIQRMKHRLLVTFEPARNRYDLSSFYIGHNRSFCLLMLRCAQAVAKEQHRPKS
ncbi:hypothetical protein SAMN04487969_104130 [Paenibacillus algorifonticola]|uniref:Uncharacterized protein n=1 Tax=Paenibacillus algorifonticola TaxID=684063 RepID=A0A1I2BWQ5_9BACL|nr:hypothetical protein [Paenibacillus algorifonticola]SFE60596.1 hypothetical protein SAMN04487969_104130 [Paenibacillus algorifonticola]